MEKPVNNFIKQKRETMPEISTLQISTPLRFDKQMAEPFCRKSVSEETRRAYRLAVNQFFIFVKNIHPTAVTPSQIIEWRDNLIKSKKRPNTVAFKLAVVRSFFEYLRVANIVVINPAATKLVQPPEVSSEPAGRALTIKEVRYLLAGPDCSTSSGARDYTLMLVMLRMGLRVSEVCSLRKNSIKWSHGRWILKFKIKGGRERTLPLPDDVKKAVDAYLKLDSSRRDSLKSDKPDSFLFQPISNSRTLVFDKGLSARQAWNIVARWSDYGRLGEISPHDLRRTAITRALDQGLSYRQVQMMSGHRDPKTIMRYDHGRENLDLNAVNFLNFDEK